LDHAKLVEQSKFDPTAPLEIRLRDGRPFVRRASFDATSKTLAAAVGKEIRFWSVETGMPAGDPLVAEQDVLGVEFGGDGRDLLAWTDDDVLMWNAKSREPLSALKGLDFVTRFATFSPDGRFVLVSGHQVIGNESWQLMAQLWEVATGNPVGQLMKWEDQGYGTGDLFVRSAFRADGRVAVTGGFPVRLWQVPSGNALGSTGDGTLAGGAERVLFGRDGQVLVLFPHGGRGHVLDVAPGLEPSLEISVPADGLLAVLPSPNGRTMVTAHRNLGKEDILTVRLFELATGNPIGEPIQMETLAGRYFRCDPAYSPNGRLLATGVGKNSCQIWDTVKGRKAGPQMDMQSFVQALAFSPDGQLLAVGDREGNIRLWNATTGQPIRTTIARGSPPSNSRYPDDDGGIRCLRFSPDGRKLLVAGGRTQAWGDARLWDVATGKPLGPELRMLGMVNDAAFSGDGKTFVTASFEVIHWNSETSERIWTRQNDSSSKVAFSPDGRLILAQLYNGAQLYDSQTGAPTCAQLRHKDAVRDVTFRPDGKMILTCSRDGTARLWDTATGLPIGPPFTNLAGAIGCFTSDSQSVLLSGKSTISCWDIAGPMEGTLERIRMAVGVTTRVSLDTYGELTPVAALLTLDPSTSSGATRGSDPLDALYKRLMELGGPPGALRR
jgi:WD40 repeat protein